MFPYSLPCNVVGMTTEPNPPLIKRGAGVSQVMRKKLNDRIPAENLPSFLITLGWIVNYEFDDLDEIESMLAQTDSAEDVWCEYEMVGSHCARLRLARDTEEHVIIDVNVPVELVPQARLAIEIFSAFTVR